MCSSFSKEVADIDQTDLHRSEPSSRIFKMGGQTVALAYYIICLNKPTSRCQTFHSIGALVPIKPVILGVAFI